jgi:hypothetical protein
VEYPCLVEGMSNPDYQAMNDHLSRSFIHSVSEYGPEALRFLDEGHSLFNGSRATSIGSNFDDLIMAVIAGKSFSDAVAKSDPNVLSPTGRRTGKKYTEWRDEQRKLGKIVVSADDEFQLRHMYDSLLRHPTAVKLVADTKRSQLSAFFMFQGEPCRVRPDGVVELDHEEPLWWDLKTTSSTWDTLYKSIFRFGYAAQEYFYKQASYQLGWPEYRMPFIFVQTVPPYSCRVYHIPEEVVADAGAKIINTIAEIRLRRKTKMYMPSVAEGIVELEVPEFARKHEEVFDG